MAAAQRNCKRSVTESYSRLFPKPLILILMEWSKDAVSHLGAGSGVPSAGAPAVEVDSDAEMGDFEGAFSLVVE